MSCPEPALPHHPPGGGRHAQEAMLGQFLQKRSQTPHTTVMKNAHPQPVPHGGLSPDPAHTEGAARGGYRSAGDLPRPPGEALTSLRGCSGTLGGTCPQGKANGHTAQEPSLQTEAALFSWP